MSSSGEWRRPGARVAGVSGGGRLHSGQLGARPAAHTHDTCISICIRDPGDKKLVETRAHTQLSYGTRPYISHRRKVTGTHVARRTSAAACALLVHGCCTWSWTREHLSYCTGSPFHTALVATSSLSRRDLVAISSHGVAASRRPLTRRYRRSRSWQPWRG